MSSEPPDSRKDAGYIDTDDLFGKLDQLISRHQGRGMSRAAPASVPTLTEAIAGPVPSGDPQIPVLSDVVELPVGALQALPQTSAEKRRQLQVALYLRLRQRVDQELGGEAFAFVPPAQLNLIVQALRNALPAIVRESVEQVLGSDDQE
jgi:hypothetical protein